MAVRQRGLVFRATGLPALLQPDDELSASLKATIEENMSEQEKSRLTVSTAVVPSCYDNKHERVALVEFHGGAPALLSELEVNPLGEWQVEIGDTDINFDRLFFGLTQLDTPKPNAPVTAEHV
jgi:hypothetical protein